MWEPSHVEKRALVCDDRQVVEEYEPIRPVQDALGCHRSVTT